MTETAPTWLDSELYPFSGRVVGIAGHDVHYVDEGAGPVAGHDVRSDASTEFTEAIRDWFRDV